ncbi:MAG TPA: nickel-dependent lactate racemase [Pyrinomonadaceae bacterium]
MREIQLKYGHGAIPLRVSDSFRVLETGDEKPALSDVELGQKLDSPIQSDTLEEIVSPGETVLFVVPDATRRSAAGQVINLLVRRLIANGTAPHEMAIIFATGIHRPVTEEEKPEILTPFIAQRIKTLDHNPRDLMRLTRLGEIKGGVPVELNRALSEFDHVITIGAITFHYFAGFTGGRKLICPGLASSKTVSATHKLAFDCETRSRRDGVGSGRLDGNAVHEAFVEAASFARPSFAVNTIVNDRGEATDIFCGDWIASHEAGCMEYGRRNTIEIHEKRDLVIAACGGFPYDLNMIQAHKGLDAAAHACNEGGTIVLLAECSEGTGRSDFLNWFDVADSAELAVKLCDRYQVNGQTAWSLLRKAEQFDVRVMTSLPEHETSPMRLKKLSELQDVIADTTAKGYILPNGAKTLVNLI